MKKNQLNKRHFVVIDFETGGLDPELHDPVQLAAFVLHPTTLEIVARFVSYIRPDPQRVTSEALKVNKLSLESLKIAPVPEAVLQMFAEFLAPFGQSFFVAHNAKFDYDFLNHWANRYGDGKFPVHKFFDYRTICTAQLALQKFVLWDQDIQRIKLSELTSFLNIPHNPHDATSDALATCELFRRCLKTPLLFRLLRGLKLSARSKNLSSLISSIKSLY